MLLVDLFLLRLGQLRRLSRAKRALACAQLALKGADRALACADLALLGANQALLGADGALLGADLALLTADVSHRTDDRGSLLDRGTIAHLIGLAVATEPQNAFGAVVAQFEAALVEVARRHGEVLVAEDEGVVEARVTCARLLARGCLLGADRRLSRRRALDERQRHQRRHRRGSQYPSRQTNRATW